MSKLMAAILLSAASAGCIRLQHLEPVPRSAEDQQRAAVRLQVSCVEDMGMDPNNPTNWVPPRVGSGVIISERHILTAYHVVSCPALPRVLATLVDGRQFTMWVIKEEPHHIPFMSDDGIAELEIGGIDWFGMDIRPPRLGPASDWHIDEVLCAEPAFPRHEDVCGFGNGHLTFGAKSRIGNSGAGVYDTAGQLVGIEDSGTDDSTHYFHVEAPWLKGT